MVAYAGDPEEDPFVLAAGRYYVETLDEDNVVTPLGSVDVEAGDPVGFPSSVTEGGGTPDPEAAEPLLTVANFLIDTELAEYAFLDIVTGGFELSPYDPEVEISPEDVIALFEAYGGILDQKDVLLAALSEVEDRAEVSSPVRRLSPGWAPSQQVFGDLREYVTGKFLKLEDDDPYGIAEILKRGKDIARREEEARIAALEESFWIVEWNEASDTVLGKKPGLLMPKYENLVARHGEWEDYARELVGTIEDEASAERAQARLKNRIADDYRAHMEANGVSPRPVDDVIINYFVTEVFTGALGPAAALAGVSATPTGGAESSTPTPDTSWVEPYVESISDVWRGMGFEESAVVASANNLRACLLAAVEMGLDDEESATALCPYEGFEPGTPTPEPSAEPTEPQEATPTPTTAGVPVSATGTFDFGDLGNAILTQNTVSLSWNTAGGPITSGTGGWRMEVQHYCGTEWESWSGQYSGTFDPALNTFSGNYTGEWARLNFHREPDGSCVQDPTGGPSTGQWAATLSGSTVTGEGPQPFHLTTGGGGAAFRDRFAGRVPTRVLLDSYVWAALPSPSRMPLTRPLETE
jgi:hypothetical protein